MASGLRTAARLGAAALALGASAVLYAHWEASSFRLRRQNLPILNAGQRELRILHVSDLHMVPGQAAKQAWVAHLAQLHPHAVIFTGDFLSHVDAIPVALNTVAPLMHLPGAFVLGSNDYYAPRPLNPMKYIAGPSQLAPKRAMLDWGQLVHGLTAAGWQDLSNRRSALTVDGRRIDVRGVDDPHIARDDYGAVAGAFDANADLRLGITHAPYLRVLDAMAADGADLILAGHTHGGQLAVPGFGALVTNCDIDRARAKGLSRHGDSALHVSAGLGTSVYAPVRFACPPEATLLTLTAGS